MFSHLHHSLRRMFIAYARFYILTDPGSLELIPVHSPNYARKQLNTRPCFSLCTKSRQCLPLTS